MEVSGQVMMAWVWLALVTLARLSTPALHRDAEEALAAPEALFLESELPEKTLSGAEFNPVPLWKFVQGGETHSGLGQPLFSCNDSSMSIRLRLIRHSDLHLSDEKGVWLLPTECGASVRTIGSWLLLKLPYTSCPMDSWLSNGSLVHQMKLSYFDHLLKANMTAVATCQSPKAGRHPTPPLVRCRTTDVTIELPLGTGLERIKAVGRGSAIGTALTIGTSPDGVFVQISTEHTDSFLEMLILDSAGEVFTVLVACVEPTGSERGRRSVKHSHLIDDWDVDVVPSMYGSEFTLEEYFYEATATTTASCVVPTTAAPSCTTTTASCAGPTTAAPSCTTTTASCAGPTTAAPSCTTTTASCAGPTTAAPSCTTTTASCVGPTTAAPSCTTTTASCAGPTTVAPSCTTTTASCAGPTTAAPSCTTTTASCVGPTTTTAAPSCTTTTASCVGPTTAAPSCTTTTASCVGPTTAAPSCTVSTAAQSCASKTTASFCVNPRGIAGRDVTTAQSASASPGTDSTIEKFSMSLTADPLTTTDLAWMDSVATDPLTTMGVTTISPTTSIEESTSDVAGSTMILALS